MEVRYNKVGIMVLVVHWRYREHQTREAPHREQHHKGDREQHWGFKRHGAAPHGGDPIEHFYAGRHRDKHGAVHKEQLARQRHTDCKHVMSPYDKGQERNRRDRVHH